LMLVALLSLTGVAFLAMMVIIAEWEDDDI
jgi:hypothetical protein